MKIKISGIILLFVLLLQSTDIHAVRAIPYPVVITQPDGTKITVQLHGDESFNFRTTSEGYLIVPDNNGFYYYGKTNNLGNIENTFVRCNNTENRSEAEKMFVKQLIQHPVMKPNNSLKRVKRYNSRASKSATTGGYPLTGSPKSLVILVNFSDIKFATPNPQTAFTNLLNQPGYSTNGGTGSAKDYFRDNSNGVFTPQFDVIGPVTLDNPMSYYGANNASGEDVNPQQMVIDACTKAASLVDFSQYDLDKDGQVDNVFIYYAGYNEAEGGPANSIWPHRWTLNNLNTRFNNVAVYDYACTSELRGKVGTNMCGIGTFCHEFGHVLGLDDFYVTDPNITDFFTLSYWDIMDSGPYLNSGNTPPSYSGYERFFLNWTVPVELKSPQDTTLKPINTSNQCYIITQNGNHNLNGAKPTPVEFFMLENRQKTGWDTYLPNHGMLIWHIFYNKTTWDDNTPNNDKNALGVSIEVADGIASYNTMSGDPFPGTSKVHEYSPTLRNGMDIGKPITAIEESAGGDISFSFIGGNRTLIKPIATSATDITTGSFIANWTPVADVNGKLFDTGYYVTAYNITDGTSNLKEGFDNGLKATNGWTITAKNASTNYNYSGATPPSIQFSNTNEFIQTEKYILPVTKLSFYIRSLSENYGKLRLEALNSQQKWIKTDSITITGSLVATKTYSFTESQAFTQFRFTFVKGNGSLLFDDVNVEFSKKLEFNAREKWVTSTSDTIMNLVPDRTYFYTIRTSDKTLSTDQTVLFESITDQSNTITVTTLPDTPGNFFRLKKDGTIEVLIPTTDLTVYVYNTIGQLVRSIKSTSNIFDIKGLPHGHIYILKAGEHRLKIILN